MVAERLFYLPVTANKSTSRRVAVKTFITVLMFFLSRNCSSADLSPKKMFGIQLGDDFFFRDFYGESRVENLSRRSVHFRSQCAIPVASYFPKYVFDVRIR